MKSAPCARGQKRLYDIYVVFLAKSLIHKKCFGPAINVAL